MTDHVITWDEDKILKRGGVASEREGGKVNSEKGPGGAGGEEPFVEYSRDTSPGRINN